VAEALRPLEGRARWAVIGLVAVILSDLVAIWSDVLEIDLMNRLIEGEEVPEEDLDASDVRQGTVALVQLAVFLVAVVFFIRWFHAAYSNLRALGQPNLRYGIGWAIGAWFVPILNLFRPKQIANDIWRGSTPEAPTLTQAAWRDVPVSPILLHVWWAAWIATSIVGNIAGRAWWTGNTPDELKSAAQLDIAASMVDIVAAVLAIAVVRSLTARQQARAHRVASEGAFPLTPESA
jgi:hypothetical protein